MGMVDVFLTVSLNPPSDCFLLYFFCKCHQSFSQTKHSEKLCENGLCLQACKEMKMEPCTHVLRHKKKDVDLTLPFRLANLSNNATLELVELDSAVSSVPKTHAQTRAHTQMAKHVHMMLGTVWM
jgi:hypothetical protein